MNSLASRLVFKRHLKLALLSTALVCVAAPTVVHAGFEWIPASEVQAQKTPKAEPAPVVAAPEVVEAPVPQQADLSAPVPVPEPAPVAVKVESEAPVVAQNDDMLSLPGAQIDDEPVIKVKNFYEEAPQQESEAVSEPVPIATLSAQDSVAAPVEEPALDYEPVEVQKEPQEVIVKRNVIIPDNAPESAVVKISKEGSVVKAAPEKVEEDIVEAIVVLEDSVASEESTADEIVIDDKEPVAVTQEDELLEFAGAPVVGFGTDMPLALALNQIVPSSYAYAFGDGVNPGYRVSWSGGKSWVDVVSDMVKPLNLMSEVRGKTIYIRAEKNEAPDAVSSMSDDTQETTELMSAQEDGSLSSVSEHVDLGEDDMVRKNVIDPGEQALGQPVQTVDALESKVRDESMEITDAPVWEARKGDSLKDTLDAWSHLVCSLFGMRIMIIV
jgi:hypothetical protein